MASFLDRLAIEGIGCIQRAEISLTPLHALIGPNDSGKTTALHAVRVGLQCAIDGFRATRTGGLEPFDPQQPLFSASAAVTLGVGAAEYSIALGSTHISDRVLLEGTDIGRFSQTRAWTDGSRTPEMLRDSRVVRANRTQPPLVAGQLFVGTSDVEFASLPAQAYRLEQQLQVQLRALGEALYRKPRLVRLDPDALRKPSRLLNKNESPFFRDDRGTGLSALLDALRDRGDSSFDDVASQLRAKFPNVSLLQLERSEDGNEKSVAVKLKDGTLVPAQLMSEGMLYFLAFLVVEKLEPAFFLIEEPENGLHPARIAEVMSIIRTMSETSQVLLATHSPLVVNELEANEVSVLRRSAEKGTSFTLLSQTADFDRRSQLYAPGELWLNYADGVEEAPLVEGGPRP
jgi:hypothetical protein